MIRLEDEDKKHMRTRTDMDIDSETFARMVESSLSGLQDGEVVSGRVVEITPVEVIIDIGYKAEGSVPVEEFLDEDGKVSVKPGDEVEVLIESRFRDGDEETIVLSRRRAGEAQAWERIEKAYRQNGSVKGSILNRVKGGFRVDVGVPAFLPGSQVDLRPVRDLDSLLGRTYDFKVLKYSRRRRNVVLSRRAILEEKRETLKKKLLATLEEGQRLTGVVKNVVKYGAFIDLGGMDGLLHVSDMSWGRIQHPGDMVRVGERLEVKVLKFDRAKERISLGLKQLTPDPWVDAEKKYPPGTKVTGQVVNVVDYGAFVEVEPGLEGLIHVSEMSWSNNIRQASQVLAENDTVEAVVLSLDAKARKLALSLRQAEDDPWEKLGESFPAGTVIEGTVNTVTEFGLFVGLKEGIDGLVHRRDIGWAGVQPRPEDTFKPGDKVQAVVLNVDPDKKRVAMGMKQLAPDPWPDLAGKISVGDRLEGRICGFNEQGVLVEVRDGAVGLMYLEDSESVESMGYHLDDAVLVLVESFDPEKRLLTLWETGP